MSGADVLKMIKDKKVKFVDFRFTDTKGKEQHVSVPASMLDAGTFEDGKMFDGSSIAGRKGIQESDMILDARGRDRGHGPVLRGTDLNLRCDVIEPSTMQGYERCPRSLAKRAEAHLKSHRRRRHRLLRPRGRIFILDDVRWGADMSGSFVKIDSKKPRGTPRRCTRDGNLGHRPGIKGGYFPVPPVDSQQDIRSAMFLAMMDMGLSDRDSPPRSGDRRPERDRHAVQHPGEEGRRPPDLQVLRA